MSEQFIRQSFLGEGSEDVLFNTRVAIIGYGGGGSHAGQQSAHVGFGDILVIDPDIVEEKNLNRLVGATHDDVKNATPKVEVAERIISGIFPKGSVSGIRAEWASQIERLRDRHIIIGCVDSFAERAALERFSRRFLIPYIDIGMDVIGREDRFQIVGQTVLSTPDHACLRCLGIIDDETLAREERARQYGDAGSKPQVVWPNGVLASTAVGLAVQLVTPWQGKTSLSAHLEYNGNRGTLVESGRHRAFVAKRMTCSHYNPDELGDPLYNIRQQ